MLIRCFQRLNRCSSQQQFIPSLCLLPDALNRSKAKLMEGTSLLQKLDLSNMARPMILVLNSRDFSEVLVECSTALACCRVLHMGETPN